MDIRGIETISAETLERVKWRKIGDGRLPLKERDGRESALMAAAPGTGGEDKEA